MTRINLIRGAVAEPRIRLWQPWRWVAMLAAAATLHWAQSAWLASATEARDSLHRSMVGLERAMAQLHSGTPRMAAAAHSGAALRLRMIAASIPPDLWLLGYRERRGEVTMRGMSLNDEAMRTFVESLSATPLFGNIEITETTRTAASGSAGETAAALYEFQLKAVVADAPPVPGQGATSAG